MDRNLLKDNGAELDFTASATLAASVEGLFADQTALTTAGARAVALGSFAENVVLDELAAALTPVLKIPNDFGDYLRAGAGKDHPRFLDLFGASIAERLKDKQNTGFRDILQTRWLADLKALGFETSEALARIEKHFDVSLEAIKQDTAEIRKRQDKEAVATARRHARTEHHGQRQLARLVIDAAGSGAPAVRAVAEIRDLLRPGYPDIDAIDAERLPSLVRHIVDQLQNPTAIEVGFSGAVKRALEEAQACVLEFAFLDAAHVLDAQLAQIQSEDRERDRGRAALLAERGRVASLQLRYQEAAKFLARAAEAVAFEFSILLETYPCGRTRTLRSGLGVRRHSSIA